MNRFTFALGKKEYTIDIEDYKFIIGNNVSQKYIIHDVARAAFNKIQNSQYAIEAQRKHQLSFNEKPIDTKVWRYFEVTPFYDLESDLKMGTKSLISKYLESFSLDLENNEIFNTISILINSLNEDFFDKETKISINDIDFSLNLNTITRSTIIKEILANLCSEGFDCNSADLCYEELILLQLSILERIALKNKDKLIFVYCNIPYITPKIKNKIIGFKYHGCFLFVDTYTITNILLEKCACFSKFYIDFANRELLLDVLMDLPFHIDVEEFIIASNNIINYSSGQHIDRRLIEMFPLEIYTKFS